VQLECNEGIKDGGSRQLLHLRKERKLARVSEDDVGSMKTFYEALGETIMVDMAKRTVRPSVRNRKMSGKTLCSG
jgi:hypothetical protein